MITSRQNGFIKRLKLLKEKKERDSSGTFIAEGNKLVKEILSSSLKVEYVVGTERGLKDISIPESVKTETVSEDVFSTVSSEKSPQGVLAVVKKPEFNYKDCSSAILLDGVSDPQNVGAVIRTAVASGFDKVFLTEDCADIFSVKAVRSSMGGVYKIPTEYVKREDAVNSVSLPFIVADMGGENVINFVPPEKFCLVIGNEGNGVSDIIKGVAEKVVSIPMKSGTESLNASVSAGILMYLLKINNKEIN